MKVLIVALLLISASSEAYAFSKCGFPPFKPLGCGAEPTCVCDKDGNCTWIFIGC